jgi:hypothetical protein
VSEKIKIVLIGVEADGTFGFAAARAISAHYLTKKSLDIPTIICDLELLPRPQLESSEELLERLVVELKPLAEDMEENSKSEAKLSKAEKQIIQKEQRRFHERKFMTKFKSLKR